jgi:hypothetical protein
MTGIKLLNNLLFCGITIDDPIPPNEKTVFILEHAEDIREYRNIHKSIGGTQVLIAATPDACRELEKQQIPFQSIETYYDPKEIYTLGMENYEKIDRLCSDIDAMLWGIYPSLKKTGLLPAKDNFYYVKILYDNLSIRILILQTILHKEKPHRIITFSSGSKGQDITESYDLPFTFEESVYSIVAKMDGWKCETRQLNRSIYSGKKEIASSNFSIPRSVKNFLKRHPGLFIPLFSLKNYGFTKTLKMIYFQRRNSFKSKNSLFLLRQEPSWSSIIFQLYQEGFQVFFLPEKEDIHRTKTALGNEIDKKLAACLQPYATFKNIDMSEVLNERFHTIIQYYFQYMPKMSEKTVELIRQYQPVAFLCSEKATFSEHLSAHIAQCHNIPVIAWQHGDGPFYPPMQVYAEIMNSDVHLSYGPGHQKMLQAAPDNHFNCRIESVGSHILENLYSTSSESVIRKKILFVTTGFYYNNLYVNSFPVNDNIQWINQKEILRVLGTSGIPTIFKLNPDNYKNQFMHEYIKENHFDNITLIRHEKPFLDLLNEADVIICDYPATPVIESIAAKKTVFVLLSSPYLRDEALTLLKKRVYWSDTIDNFVRMIADYLENKPLDQNPDIHNTEYLEMYGTHKLDGNVAMRALEILKREIRDRN